MFQQGKKRQNNVHKIYFNWLHHQESEVFKFKFFKKANSL